MNQQPNLDELSINTIRMLAVDMVEAAASGHPGMPLGAAPMAYVLFNKIMRHNPANPKWFDRDRFILSAGHGSALLYALLHLTGYDLPLQELKRFRQFSSKTPGHPELHETPGVEMTTGPLGQGFATGVGMAVAERILAADFNRPHAKLVDHYTYAIVSDGDLMEGVSAEAASLAGHLKLGKLIYLYDDNHISIEGSTHLAFSEDVGKRFAAYGWHVLKVADGNDLKQIESCLVAAQQDPRPSLVMVRTHIGFGSPKQDSAAAHGEPLGKEALQATREFYGWNKFEAFHIPEAVEAHLRGCLKRGQELEAAWQQKLATLQQQEPTLAQRFTRQSSGTLPENWQATVPRFKAEAKASMATRVASGKVINALASQIPELVGGSADLAPSTKTLIEGAQDCSAEAPAGRNLRFGVREHAMGCCINGMSLHGGLRPYGATFFVFSDYMRPALRMAAIMRLKVIQVFTHDSIGLGEDGPTHQPIEHLASLRAMPGLTLLRPADANETAAAWSVALLSERPVALVLSRQNLPILDSEQYGIAEGVAKGAYILLDSAKTPELILIASGSEVHLALAAAEKLTAQGRSVRVVSMPAWQIFAEQPLAYREQILPSAVQCRLAMEAGSSFGWQRWVGEFGKVIGLDHFGASAPGEKLMEHFGFSVDNVLKQAQALLA